MGSFIVRQPQRQRDHEPLGGHLITRQPDRAQRLEQRRIGVPRRSAWPSCLSTLGCLVQAPQRILAMVPTNLAKLVEDLGLLSPVCFAVAPPNGRQICLALVLARCR